VQNWKQHRRLSLSDLSGAHRPQDGIGYVRYSRGTRSQYPGMGGTPRSGAKVVAGVAGAAVMALAGTLGVFAGTQLPQTQPAHANVFVPASTLIASQNLPAKLPLIEKVESGTRLETGARPGNVLYVAQLGDTFTTVGRKFNLRPRTVRLVNMLPIGARLKNGQKLTITPEDGAYHRVRSGENLAELADRYGVSTEALLEKNPGVVADKLAPETSVFVPGAMELRYRTARTEKQRGYRVNEPWAKRLSASRSLVGAFGSRVGELAWPAAGQLSSPFGIRGFSFHPGVDICNAVGTPIRAAKGGTVVSSGWMGAYGYAVDVDHGGGVITRYGHCSRLLVAAGQNVEAGEEIAKMGSTGRSTGPHVHFEVRLQGRAVNPTAFF
jgi:murein DD-endopeptidase MepM/ murein hydrolase activator NlpD